MPKSARNVAIHPGTVWMDTSGQRIHAHGGSILTDTDGSFIWYGENKERSTPGSGIWHWGIRAYRSTDLMNWDDCGLIIPPVLDDENSPLHPSQYVDRPHILRHPTTGRYICWLKVMGRFDMSVQSVTILESDDVLGPWSITRSGTFPLDMSAGDFDLFIDPESLKGHYFFDRVHCELVVADLDDSYAAVNGRFSAHFRHPGTPFTREAPAHFARAGLHYLVTSGTTWYWPNPSQIAAAHDVHGPWTLLGDPHRTDRAGTSFRSQISSVFKHPAKRDLYIAIADRWIPDARADIPSVWDLAVDQFYGREPEALRDPEFRRRYQAEVDTSMSDYVWLPITFDEDVPQIRWRDTCTPDEFD